MFPLVNGSDSVARALNCIRNLLHQSTGGTSSLPCEALVPVRWIYLRSRGIPTLPPREACWSLSKELQRLQDIAQSGELGKFNDPFVKLSTAFAYDSVLGQYVRLFVCDLPDTIFYWGNCVWSKPSRSRDDRISAVIATSSEVGCTVHQLIHSFRQQPESLIEPLSYHAIRLSAALNSTSILSIARVGSGLRPATTLDSSTTQPSFLLYIGRKQTSLGCSMTRQLIHSKGTKLLPRQTLN